MPISVRLKPELERLLDEVTRREGKTRSAVVHHALAAFLKGRRPRLAEVIRRALKLAPEGFGIERNQAKKADRRAWKR